MGGRDDDEDDDDVGAHGGCTPLLSSSSMQNDPCQVAGAVCRKNGESRVDGIHRVVMDQVVASRVRY